MRKMLLAAAAGTTIAAAAPFMFASLDQAGRTVAVNTPNPALAALNPLFLANSLCGRPTEGRWASRRQAFVAAAAAYAEDGPISQAPGDVPFVTGLGPSSMLITTSDVDANQYFQQGLRYMHGFNHGAAIESFRAGQARDPECAMCYWGEAISLGPNINAPMDPADSPRAYEAAHQAYALAQEGGTAVEKALTEALLVRYEETAPADRTALDEAYRDAMAEVADQFLDNDEIQALAAEAIMDAQPWFYWAADGVTPVGMSDEAIDRIETVLTRNPEHVPSIHLYIHLTEASADPWRAEQSADNLVGLAPAAGHLVHMPSHTFYRIGRFQDSLQANLAAVLADEAYLAENEGGVIYRYGYYTHNIHFVLTSAQMAGDAETALEMAEKLDGALPMEMASAAPWVTPIKAAPWYAQAQFGDPEDVLAMPAPDAEGLPFLTAAWRYARGEAQAKLGNVADAVDEAQAIAELRETADFTPLTEGGVPALETLEIMEHLIRGRAADAQGDLQTAIEHYQAAADIQASLPYTEPPYWWYPVRQTLASALLRAGRAEHAELEFYRTLIESPDNAAAYWGLAQARRALGDNLGAADAMRGFNNGWAGARNAMSLERL
jgi:tetratricopeptide (TPR) repeat protein